MEAAQIDKGLQQQQRVSKAGLPIGRDPPFGRNRKLAGVLALVGEAE